MNYVLARSKTEHKEMLQLIIKYGLSVNFHTERSSQNYLQWTISFAVQHPEINIDTAEIAKILLDRGLPNIYEQSTLLMAVKLIRFSLKEELMLTKNVTRVILH